MWELERLVLRLEGQERGGGVCGLGEGGDGNSKEGGGKVRGLPVTWEWN